MWSQVDCPKKKSSYIHWISWNRNQSLCCTWSCQYFWSSSMKIEQIQFAKPRNADMSPALQLRYPLYQLSYNEVLFSKYQMKNTDWNQLLKSSIWFRMACLTYIWFLILTTTLGGWKRLISIIMVLQRTSLMLESRYKNIVTNLISLDLVKCCYEIKSFNILFLFHLILVHFGLGDSGTCERSNKKVHLCRSCLFLEMVERTKWRNEAAGLLEHFYFVKTIRIL